MTQAEFQGTVRAPKKVGLFLAGAPARPAATLGQATNRAWLSVGTCPFTHHKGPKVPIEERGNQVSYMKDVDMAFWSGSGSLKCCLDPSSSCPQGSNSF